MTSPHFTTPNKDALSALQAIHNGQLAEKKYVSVQANKSKDKAWLTTFVDLVCLMLTFFVFLFALGTPDQNQWQNISESLSKAFPIEERRNETQNGSDLVTTLKATMRDLLPYRDQDYTASLIQQDVMALSPELRPEIKIKKNSTNLSWPPTASLFSNQDLDQVNPQALAEISTLFPRLKVLSKQIQVTAYVSFADAEKTYPRYTHPLHLAMARAEKIAKPLAEGRDKRDIVVGARIADRGSSSPKLVITIDHYGTYR